MPPESARLGSAQDWLSRARSDLALARGPLPEGAILEDLCYHAQQATEKGLKAVYRALDIDEYDQAVVLAGAVVEWVEAVLGRQDSGTQGAARDG